MKGSILISKTQERIALDKKNQAILQMLVDNSRTSLSKISKKVKISRPAVLQRIKQMEEKKIILQYISYYNLIRAGYQFHVIFLETNKEDENKFIGGISKHKFSAAVSKIASKFNILWMVFSKNPKHLNKIISEVSKIMSIKDLKILPIIENYFDNYKLFSESKKELKEFRGKVELNSIDAKILNSLKNNSKISLVKISEKCRLSAEAIQQRIKKLVEKGIILNFFTNFDIHKLGFQPYVFLIKTSRHKQKEIMNFIRQHENTNGQYFLDSEYDIMCVLVVKNILELKEFTEKLNKLFRENIIDYEIHLVIDQFLSDFFPEGIYEDIVNRKKQFLKS
ncbi:Lrp/AsnC family transcriptional regulator [Candidatus Pacearchaeota archaeon]|nr:Lrp/AsnC family transcriptional regulator [Candidatus Pacearchaeota archaeon]